jgi:hypothetical protein
LVKISRAQVLIGLLPRQHVLHNDRNGMAQGHECAFLAPPGGNALVLDGEVGLLGFRRHMGRFHQHLAPPSAGRAAPITGSAVRNRDTARMRLSPWCCTGTSEVADVPANRAIPRMNHTDFSASLLGSGFMRAPGEIPMKVLMTKGFLAMRSHASKPCLSNLELTGTRFTSMPVMPGGTSRRNRC